MQTSYTLWLSSICHRVVDISEPIVCLCCSSPIYACIGMQQRDPSWQTSYALWPAGVCHRVVNISEPLHVASWANATGGFADRWTHHSDSFDVKSWERVANDEMWHAKYALFTTGTACIVGGSIAEWLVCWTQAQKGPGSNRSCDAVG